jgi:hypothetical protein
MFATEYGILRRDYKRMFSLPSTNQGNHSLPNNWVWLFAKEEGGDIRETAESRSPFPMHVSPGEFRKDGTRGRKAL